MVSFVTGYFNCIYELFASNNNSQLCFSLSLFLEQFKKMYVQKVKEQEKAYNKQVQEKS